MKVHKVDIEGFGPFKGKETVDFDACAAEGKFVITGKTGAGKTSILDAVTFALFGRVPRYHGAADDWVRSDYLHGTNDLTEVTVEFSVGEKRYRVCRRPSYIVPSRKTPIACWAEISELRDGEWHALASRQLREVAAKIDEIVGLNADQFQQVILLPQGQFQEFLVADSKTRRALLRKLFNTNRFCDYSDGLDTRAGALKKSLDLTSEAVAANAASLASEAERELPAELDTSNGSVVLAWAEPIVTEQQEKVSAAKTLADQAKSAYDEALAALAEAERITALQRRKGDAETRQKTLAAEKEAVDAWRTQLDEAQRAELAWPAVEAEREAADALTAAAASFAAADAAYIAVFPNADRSPATLTAQANSLTGEVATLAEVAEREEKLGDLENTAEVTAASARLKKATVGELEVERTRLKESVPKLDEEITAATEQAAELVEAEKLVGEVARQHDGALAAEKTRADLKEAQAALVEASAVVEKATGVRAALVRQQFAEYAGVLATELVDGCACAVCGSTSHPSPAELGERHVTESDVTDADSAVGAAESGYQAANKRVGVLTERLTTELKAAKDRSSEVLAAELLTAATAQKRAAEAQAMQTELTKRRNALQGNIEALVEKVELAKEAQAVADGNARQAQALYDKEKKAVDKARGNFSSVADRVSETTSHLKTTRSALDATNDRNTKKVAAGKSTAKLAATLKEQGFDAPKDVVRTRLPKSGRDELGQKLRRHDADTEAIRQTLADKELAGLPTGAIDLGPLQVAHDKTVATHSEAMVALGQAQKRAATIQNLVKDIRKRLKEAGSTLAEYEVVNRLAATVRGQSPNTKKMTLETFALAADLEEIVTAANVLLGKMTAHRYELRYTDELAKGGGQSGLAIQVIDAYNAESRPPQSLSGGEKFQASLALALGLAEVVTSRNGGVRLDTLFIDEGFGALDSESLDLTLDTVDALREGGRTVGLISHVGQVKERIANHIDVCVTEHGWSTLTG